MNNIGHYGKSITYVALAAVTFLVTALTDDTLSMEEFLNLGVVILGAVGVYVIPNSPEGVARFLKTGVTAATAALVAILSFLTDGISTTEWLQIGIATLAAVGVYIVPNEVKIPASVVVNNVGVDAGKTGDGYHG